MFDGALRSTPFRVALILGGTLVAALLVAGLAAYTLIQHELGERIDKTITDTYQVIAEAYGDSDQTDLIDAVRSHARASINSDRIYGLEDPTGQILAGNVPKLPKNVGWQTLTAYDLGLPGSDSFRVFIGTAADNKLLVGNNLGEASELGQISLSSLLASSLVIIATVVAVGGFVATRAQRRIDSIALAMAKVGQGQLDARIAVDGRGDDIDQLATQVNAALDRLSSLVASMQQVSVDIAHDLKTPLNRLAITVESARSVIGTDAKAAAHLSQADAELRQINSTFDALLRIAQLEAGARRARFVRVQLASVLERIENAYTDVADEAGQRLVVRTDSALPEIDGDVDLLTQLCANLVENSIRHSPAGTAIDVSARMIGSRVVVTFGDDGPGIPVAEHQKVFRRLYRLEKSRTSPGSGLGLSLVKAIADLHGASISLAELHPGLAVDVAFAPAVPSI